MAESQAHRSDPAALAGDPAGEAVLGPVSWANQPAADTAPSAR
jgi:hypothetical protein